MSANSPGVNRRNFIKRGSLFVPAIFLPRILRAQSVLTADGLAAFGKTAAAGGGGGGGCDSVNDSSLGGYWRLDESSGSRADTKNSHNLTDSGSTGSAAAIVGNGASFSAATGLTVADTADLSLGTSGTAFSVAFWTKASSLSTTQVMVSKSGEYAIYFTNTTLNYVTAGGSGTNGSMTSPITFATGTWYFIVVTGTTPAGDGSFTKAIIVNNGTPQTAACSVKPVHTTDAFCVGCYQSSINFKYSGLLDEVLFTKRVLTSGEITALYNSGAGCRPSGV